MKSSLPSTFRGDRGGPAEDAELLAELRAISAKSSSANRFQGDAREHDNPSPTIDPTKASLQAKAEASRENQTNPLRSIHNDQKLNNEAIASEDSVSLPGGSTTPTTDIGMGDIEVVSTDNNAFTLGGAERKPTSNPDIMDPVSGEMLGHKNRHVKDSPVLPPWKESKRKLQLRDQKGTLSFPTSQDTTTTGSRAFVSGAPMTSSLRSTFSGDRGGPAEDAELLAELRAISEKSGSLQRFQVESDVAGSQLNDSKPVQSKKNGQSVIDPASLIPVSDGPTEETSCCSTNEELRGDSVLVQPSEQFEGSHLGSTNTGIQAATAALQDKTPGHGVGAPMKSLLPSTFRGNRGGPAEDAELLAELRAVSAKSGSVDRFQDDGTEEIITLQNASSGKGEDPRNNQSSSTRLTQNGQTQNETATTSRVTSANPVTIPPNTGATSSISTRLKSRKDSLVAPPWKQKSKRNQLGEASVVPEKLSSAGTPGLLGYDEGPPMKSPLLSTFRGDRGGPAQDAELLAELRAISTKSGSVDRFQDTETKKTDPPPIPSADEEGNYGDSQSRATQMDLSGQIQNEDLPLVGKGTNEFHSKAIGDLGAGIDVCGEGQTSALFPSQAPIAAHDPSVNQSSELTTNVTRDNLRTSIVDKNWKVRKQSYELLHVILSEVVQENGAGNIDANLVLLGLDSLVPSLLNDSNATALDSALQFALLYADSCLGAAAAEQAATIATSLINGPAFAATRPSTVKLCSALVLKLMEVGNNGAASVQSVVEVLLTLGLTSRKPKIVLTASSLVLEAAYTFGAANLPLAAVSSSSASTLAHSNAKVRENGMRVLAEICRALGSRDPLKGVISELKSSQVSVLDGMLLSQPDPTPIGTVLRSARVSTVSSSVDALAAFQVGTKELESRRYAERPETNILEKLSKTDFTAQIKLQKWSEKVGALDILLSLGGDRPYKLKQPSSGVNYGPLISDMKKLAYHTHFAVGAKSMQVLSMLAEGVGEKLYAQLRPLVIPLLELSKDKKRTQAVASCLDSFFGNVLGFEHLLEDEDSIPCCLDERRQKNALVRLTALEFLARSVVRNVDAGPRGQLNQALACKIGVLSISKSNDSDVAVRKVALELLRSLQSVDCPDVKESVASVVEDLKVSNPRLYKLLRGTSQSMETTTQTQTCTDRQSKSSSMSLSKGGLDPALRTKGIISAKPKSTVTKPVERNDGILSQTGNDRVPSLEDALAGLSALKLPRWDDPEDDGGILAGLQSSKWLSRQNAIRALAVFSKSDGIQVSVMAATSLILVVVKENTRGFKETNINVTKAILELFLTLGDIHEAGLHPFPDWATEDAINLALDKIGDKKLSATSKALLTQMCVVHPPSSVLETAARGIEKMKSPLSREELLTWVKFVLTQFGLVSIQPAANRLVPWLLQECQGSNLKLKKAALSVLGELHSQAGPVFQAIALSFCKDGALQSSLEATFADHPFDTSSSTADWPKRCIVSLSSKLDVAAVGETSMTFDIPKTDLTSKLPPGWPSKIGAKEGKTAWKTRKEALDDLEEAINSISGLLETSNLKAIVDLLRALRERFSDSQSNLRPLAVKLVGSVLSKADKSTQAKLGKVVYSAIVNSALNDNKKQMRDAALDALRSGTTVSDLEGGGPNELALEFFIVSLVSELNGSEYKASGISDVLLFAVGVAAYLPKLDDVNIGGQSLADKFAGVAVACLTSSKLEIRSAAEELLNNCLRGNVISFKSVMKGAGRLKPAQQRSVGAIIAKLEKCDASWQVPGKESGPTDRRMDIHEGSSLPDKLVSKKETSPERAKERFTEAATASLKSPKKIGLTVHPLMGNMSSAAVKKARTSARALNWPEYPEEPINPVLLANLKKVWTPLLPAASVDSFFPNSGIKKQDDGKDGCHLISRTIALERSGEGEVLVEQLDFVLKWLAIVLCGRESSVGQQALLSVLLELFDFMKYCSIDLSDSDAAVIVPHLYDKASFAKGRFREQFLEVIAVVEAGEVIQAKRLGPIVGVPLMERSVHAKTRLMGYQASLLCVERVGLSGIGKKGVLVAAKCLSEESLPENRGAALELLNSVLLRMNGDITRLSKICGANLTDKARSMLDGLNHKRDGKQGGMTPSEVNHQSLIPTPTISRRLFDQGVADQHMKPSSGDVHLSDQLPALQLRYSTVYPTRPTSTPTTSKDLGGPFAFSMKADEMPPTDTSTSGLNVINTGASGDNDEGSGAAASLRARLLKFREKNKVSERALVKIDHVAGDRQTVYSETFLLDAGRWEHFETAFNNIKILLESPTPFTGSDPKVVACEKTLRVFHAAISGEPIAESELTETQLESLKRDIEVNTNEVVQYLSKVIGCSFSGGPELLEAGLLFTCLATLISLFRNSDLTKRISIDSLSILINEVVVALLDPRLASPPQQELSNLDETTSSQLVRAINKLAIQASVGAPRLVAFQSMMTLHQRLILQASDVTTGVRLIKVVAKLFARVVKAETSSATPFSGESLDMSHLVLSVNEFLVESEKSKISNDEYIASCRSIAKTLVEAIMNAKGGGSYLRVLMQDLSIDGDMSPLASVVSSCEDLMDKFHSEKTQFGDLDSLPISKDVASLVSAIGSAQEGPERHAALGALRRYVAEHGDGELSAHLQEVSATFRKYILAQLSDGRATSKRASESIGMSERLQHLRSKMNATEASVVSAVENATFPDIPAPSQSHPLIANSSSLSSNNSSSHNQLVTDFGKAAPPMRSGTGNSHSSIQSLRERLAAAQDGRSRTESGVGTLMPIGSSATSMGHAAALRARLEAVKRQNNAS